MTRSERAPLWALAVLALLCVVVLARTSFRSDMGDFLPKAHDLGQQALDAQVSSGGASRILLLAIDGAPAPVLARLSRDLGAQLRANPRFVDVLNGDAAALAGVQTFVWQHRYLLSDAVTPQAFTETGLRAALQADLQMLNSDLGAMTAASLGADPTGAAMHVAQQLGAVGAAGPQTRDGAWLTHDGATALLLLRTRAPGFDIDAQAAALDDIHQRFATLRATQPGAEHARLRASGPGVFAVDTRDVTKRDVTRLSILASAGAIAFLLVAYRSPRALLLGLLPVACGGLAATAAVSLAFGFVHAITLGFGVTLIGEAMDYSIYLLTQTLKGDRADATLARIWPTLRLGALTSIAGFCTMLLSDFTGFAQLGLFSVAGLLAASGVTRFVLPRLVPGGFYAAGANRIGTPLRLLLRWQHQARGGLALLAVAALIALIAHRGPVWDTNLLNLSPLPPATQALDKTLRHELGVPDTRFFVAYRSDTAQDALQTSERLQAALATLVARKSIGTYDLPSLVLPADRTQLARRDALPDAATLRATLARAAAGQPFQPGLFEPFVHDVAAARSAGLLNETSLPAPLKLRLDAMLMPAGTGWIVLAPLNGVTDPDRVRAQLHEMAADTVFVDLETQSAGLLHIFEHEATTLAIAGSAAILLILGLGLRSLRRVAAVAVPVAAATMLTAAILTLHGPLSIFMVAGFLLIVALGSNYCLFFAQPHASATTRERALASIMLANLCTVAAYGLLSFSRIPVLHDIGLTVAIGTFLCLLCGAILSATSQPR